MHTDTSDADHQQWPSLQPVRYYSSMYRLLGFLLLSGLGFAATEPPLAVHLHSSLSSPQQVGTPIGLMPQPEHAGKGMLVFRYSVSVNGGPFRTVRDFSQQPLFAWAPELF